jgi:hypothetical protein
VPDSEPWEWSVDAIPHRSSLASMQWHGSAYIVQLSAKRKCLGRRVPRFPFGLNKPVVVFLVQAHIHCSGMQKNKAEMKDLNMISRDRCWPARTFKAGLVKLKTGTRLVSF